jgi:hypothetical protein
MMYDAWGIQEMGRFNRVEHLINNDAFVCFPTILPILQVIDHQTVTAKL